MTEGTEMGIVEYDGMNFNEMSSCVLLVMILYKKFTRG